MEKFTVLMSVYNKEKSEFFDLSLDSILVKQTLKPDEFVLICDGELTADLERTISKYQQLFPNILKVYRKQHEGLGKALNYGLQKCSFSLVARADSDDVCTPNRFEKQIGYLSEYPEIGVLSAYIDEFSEEWTKPSRIRVVPLIHEEIYRMAKLRCPMNHMAIVMRKNDIIQLGGYRNLHYIEDYDLWVRAMMNKTKFANIGEVLVHARVGNGMAQRRGAKKQINSRFVMNRDMVRGGMIGYGTFLRNMIVVTAFVCLPASLKELMYKKIFRKDISDR